jgi:PadR family transcriptional regulator PadR
MGSQITLQTLKVLVVLSDQPADHHYGLEIAKAAGLATGTLYPILARLERLGWVTSDWEAVDPAAEGRPRRRYYRLTLEGERVASRELAKAQQSLAPRRSWPRPGRAHA